MKKDLDSQPPLGYDDREVSIEDKYEDILLENMVEEELAEYWRRKKLFEKA